VGIELKGSNPHRNDVQNIPKYWLLHLKRENLKRFRFAWCIIIADFNNTDFMQQKKYVVT